MYQRCVLGEARPVVVVGYRYLQVRAILLGRQSMRGFLADWDWEALACVLLFEGDASFREADRSTVLGIPPQ